MIAKTAVMARAGMLPVAAMLTLVCSFTARSEEAPAADRSGDTAAATQNPDSAADAAASVESGEKATDTAADAAKKPADGEEVAKKVKVPEPALKDGGTDTAAAKDGGAEPAATDSKTTEPAKKANADAADGKDADKTQSAETAAPANADNAAAGAKPAADEAAKPDAQKAESGGDAAAKAAADSVSAPADAKAADAAKTSDDADAAKKAEANDDDAKTDEAKKAETPAEPVKAQAAESKDGPAEAEKAEDATGSKPPVSTSALPEPSADEKPAAGGVADAVLPPADPIVAEVRSKLASAGKDDDSAAIVSFYEARSGPAIWVSENGLTDKGKAVVKEIGKADDWGLPASDFVLPRVGSSLTPAAAADAEITIAKAILKYARYARGGRINPSQISRLMDVNPPVMAPKTVLTDIAIRSEPDAYLRGLQPKHEQFERLRQVLLKLRGNSEVEEEEEAPEDPALAVKLPPGGIIRVGQRDSQVLLLRQRLKVPADDMASENLYDEELAEAVRKFQRDNRLRPDAIIGNNTRAVLNGQPRPQPTRMSGDAKIQRVLINMERWRWLPEDLGSFYVWDNVPEALTRVVRDGKIIHTDRIVVGQPSWPTPFFSADMKTVVFHPSWGVPPGIKAKELAPLLRKSSGGAGLFGIFGGGYSAQAVLDAYQLKAYIGGRQVNANQVDWNSVNMGSVSFTQPPGPKNPLGQVKFMFPNKHDVYMHDTPEKELFSRSSRALSHGCMRVQDPRKFAEIILGEDKGWSADKVRGMFNGYSSTVALSKHIPVHVTYMTARVDDNGRLLTFPDFYGLDGRTTSALTGRRVDYQQVDAYQDDYGASSSAPSYSPEPRRQRKKEYSSGPPTLADAINNLFSP